MYKKIKKYYNYFKWQICIPFYSKYSHLDNDIIIFTSKNKEDSIIFDTFILFNRIPHFLTLLNYQEGYLDKIEELIEFAPLNFDVTELYDDLIINADNEVIDAITGSLFYEQLSKIYSEKDYIKNTDYFLNFKEECNKFKVKVVELPILKEKYIDNLVNRYCDLEDMQCAILLRYKNNLSK